ncbi:hypothetical protein FRC09_010018, partial [Ceratobasidium sp. 395]
MAGPDLLGRQGLFQRNPRGFSIHAARNAQYVRDGAKDYAKCIRKYRIAGTTQTPFFFDPQSSCLRRYIRQQMNANSLQLSVGGRIPAVNQDPDDGMAVVQANDIQNDTEYSCPVTIGTPGVTLILDFDTGSSDFWVWSSEFRASCSDLQGHNIYNPKKSRTSETLPGESWEIKYGDGSYASGDVHLDTIVIGDIEIKRQAVEVSQELSTEFLQGKSDGLLGLAFPRLNTVKPHQQKTPMQNMIEQGLVKDDTGTTLILLDDATVESLYSRISGARLDEGQ